MNTSQPSRSRAELSAIFFEAKALDRWRTLPCGSQRVALLPTLSEYQEIAFGYGPPPMRENAYVQFDYHVIRIAGRAFVSVTSGNELIITPMEVPVDDGGSMCAELTPYLPEELECLRSL